MLSPVQGGSLSSQPLGLAAFALAARRGAGARPKVKRERGRRGEKDRDIERERNGEIEREWCSDIIKEVTLGSYTQASCAPLPLRACRLRVHEEDTSRGEREEKKYRPPAEIRQQGFSLRDCGGIRRDGYAALNLCLNFITQYTLLLSIELSSMAVVCYIQRSDSKHSV